MSVLQINNKSEVQTVLCTGGIDPTALAGLAVDARALQSIGVHSALLPTCNTWQNSSEWGGLIPTELQTLDKTLQVLANEFTWQACKVGMLGSDEQIKWLAGQCRNGSFPNLVYDPVLGATAGGVTIDSSLKTAIVDTLFSEITLLTPNLHEVEFFTGIVVKTKSDMKRAARKLYDMGVANIYIKGGHFGSDVKIDYFYDGENEFYLQSEFTGLGARGTGCALASLIAGGLALGYTLEKSIKSAHIGVQKALSRCHQIGQFNARALFLNAN